MDHHQLPPIPGTAPLPHASMVRTSIAGIPLVAKSATSPHERRRKVVNIADHGQKATHFIWLMCFNLLSLLGSSQGIDDRQFRICPATERDR